MPFFFLLTPFPIFLQAIAAARISNKPGIHKAAECGDVDLVQHHLIADASCASRRGHKSACFCNVLRAPLLSCVYFHSWVCNYVFSLLCALLVMQPPCTILPGKVTPRFAKCCCPPIATSTPATKSAASTSACFLQPCSPMIFCPNRQCTALHYSTEDKHAKICEMLLSANCDVNARDQECGTHLCLFFATVFADDFLSHQAMDTPTLFCQEWAS